jgi:hypothetical protein
MIVNTIRVNRRDVADKLGRQPDSVECAKAAVLEGHSQRCWRQYGGSFHQSGMLGVKRVSAMHGAGVVPQQRIARPPFVRVDKFRTRCPIK